MSTEQQFSIHVSERKDRIPMRGIKGHCNSIVERRNYQNIRNHLACWMALILLAAFSHVGAQALETQNWPEWNATSAAVFPDNNWLQYQTPEEAGWSSVKLQAAEKWFTEGDSAAVMVIYNGAILARWGQTERRFMCHSIRKSLLSALYGIAVDKGSINLNETIGSIGIDDINPLSASEKSAKVSDLLKARSGIYHQAAYWRPENPPARGSHAPGTHWYYNNWDFNALSTIYNKKTSRDLFESFAAEIAKPTQMQDFELRHTYYHLEPKKSRHPAYPFRMSTRDLARFGLLYLNEGKWKDRQLIPSAWVDESTRSHSANYSGGYGYMWWTARKAAPLGQLNTYWAAGYGGHRIFVVPGAKLVLVHRADTYAGNHVNNIYIQAILREVLQARTGPPSASPKLVKPNIGKAATVGPGWSKQQMLRLAGKYHKNDYSISVDEIAGRLQITNPYSGKFYLRALSATEFQVEDEQYRGEFVQDDKGNTVSLRIWARSDKPVKFQRSGSLASEK